MNHQPRKGDTPSRDSGSPDGIYLKRVNFFKGIDTWFDLDKETIVSVWLSNWTGREVIRLNDQIVASRRVISLQSEHSFEHGGKTYRVTVDYKKLTQFRIELWQGDQLVDFDVISQGRVFQRGQGAPKATKKTWITGLMVGLTLGAMGALFGYWLGQMFGA